MLPELLFQGVLSEPRGNRSDRCAQPTKLVCSTNLTGLGGLDLVLLICDQILQNKIVAQTLTQVEIQQNRFCLLE
jgi:hypothetical protein